MKNLSLLAKDKVVIGIMVYYSFSLGGFVNPNAVNEFVMPRIRTMLWHCAIRSATAPLLTRSQFS